MNTSQIAKAVIYIVLLLLFREIISDWEHFKAGVTAALS